MKQLLRLIICLGLILPTPLALAEGPATPQKETQNPAADTHTPAPLAQILRSYGDDHSQIPKDKKELIEFLSKEFQQASSKHLEAMLLSTPASVTQALVKAMVHSEDVENLGQLMEEFENNEAVYLKFLIATSEELKKDPKKLDKIIHASESLRLYYATKKFPLPPVGERMLQGTMMVLGAMGMVYSNLDLINASGSFGDTVFTYAPMMLMGVLASSFVGEVMAFRNGWKDYFRRARGRHRAEKTLKNLKPLLASLKDSPSVQAQLQALSYVGSTKAETAALHSIEKITANYINEIELLRSNPDTWSSFREYFLSKRFFSLTKKLNSGLSESEKELLMDKAADSKIPLPLDLKAEQLAFEKSLLIDFHDWMTDEGQTDFTKRYRRVLAQRRFKEDVSVDHVAPRNSYTVMTAGLSLAVGAIGVTLAVTAGHSQEYSEFLPDVVQFLMKNKVAILNTSGLFIILPWLGQVKGLVSRYLKYRDLNYYSPIRHERLEPLTKLITRAHRIGLATKYRCKDLLKRVN